MDIEYIKGIIYHLDDQKRIQPGDYLSAEVISILKDGKMNDRSTCFAPTKTDSKQDVCLFTCEITCSGCGKILIKQLSKTALLDYLKDDTSRNSKPIFCEDCKREQQIQSEIQKIKNEQEYRELMKLRAEEKVRNAKDYIALYLNPNIKWESNINQYERRDLILYNKSMDDDIVADFIKKMPYKDFLKTPYWTTISAHKKRKVNYKCALCGGNKNLATHHSTYDRHGYEHFYDVINKDLIVLCSDCHSKFHNKIEHKD